VTDRYGRCELFVFTANIEEVLELLRDCLSVDIQPRNRASYGSIEFDVRHNSDSDSSQVDDFVFWPTVVDIEAMRDIIDADTDADHPMVRVLSILITAAWSRGLKVVAACDFEAELPWSGGIARLR
jgi:hypothetical protein